MTSRTDKLIALLIFAAVPFVGTLAAAGWLAWRNRERT